jgi:hypothetical protein
MFFTANYIVPAQYKHNIDQCVSIIYHLWDWGQDRKRLSRCSLLTIWILSHSNDFGNSMINVFENMFEMNIGITPLGADSRNWQEGGKLNILWGVRWLLPKEPVGVIVLYMLHNGLPVVWNKLMEQHQILAVMVRSVLCKASYHCSWQVKLSEMVWQCRIYQLVWAWCRY